MLQRKKFVFSSNERKCEFRLLNISFSFNVVDIFASHNTIDYWTWM